MSKEAMKSNLGMTFGKGTLATCFSIKHTETGYHIKSETDYSEIEIYIKAVLI